MLHLSSTAHAIFLPLLLASSALGCASADLDDPGQDLHPVAQLSPSAPMSDAGVALPFFATLKSNGTGCPSDSSVSWLAADGHTLTTTFSRYEAEVEDGQRVSFKDCNQTLKLHSDTPLSFAVDAFHYQGYAYVETGVRGFFTGNYYFQGGPVPPASAEKRTDLIGPVDRNFVFNEQVADADLVWSACGHDRNLLVVTRAGLQKQQNKGSGYVSLSTLDALYEGRVRYSVRWRPCVEEPDAGRAPGKDAGLLDAGVP